MTLCRVCVCPDYRAANPYQRLLYHGLHPRNLVRFAPWQEALAASARPPQELAICHLHWEDAIYRLEPSPEAARAEAQRFLDALDGFRDRGGAFFWTVHNQEPHDGSYLEVHQALGRALAAAADRILVHHPTALAIARERLGAPLDKLVIAPHGNFLDVHSPLGPGRAERRAAAGFAATDLVLLLFGRLGAYKGGAELVRAFGRVDERHLRLVLAGKQVDPLGAELDELAPAVRARIRVEDRFFDEAEIAPLFDLADIVTLPYRAILTSGTAMLAFSLGRPVLAPSLPALEEWVRDGKNGILYAADEPTALEAALRRLVELGPAGLERLQAPAAATAARHEWAPARAILNALYAEALLASRPPRLVDGLGWFALD